MKVINFLILLMVVLLTACQKENIDEIIPGEPNYHVDTIDTNPLILRVRGYSSDSLILDCIRIPYPVDFLQASGNTITVNTEAELESALMLPDSIVDFVYPFEARDDDGFFTVRNIEDLVIKLQFCESAPIDCSTGQDAHVLLFFNALNILTLNKYVYDINYPVNMIVQGNRVVINNDDEYLPAVGGSPFDLLPAELVYPVSIRQFGRDIILNNDEEVCQFYETLDEPCENKPAHIQFFFNDGPGTRISCTYFIEYPVSVTFNNNTIDIPSRQDYLDLLDSSPNAYDGIEMVYPATVSKYINGQQIRFETDAEICQYLEDCK